MQSWVAAIDGADKAHKIVPWFAGVTNRGGSLGWLGRKLQSTFNTGVLGWRSRSARALPRRGRFSLNNPIGSPTSPPTRAPTASSG